MNSNSQLQRAAPERIVSLPAVEPCRPRVPEREQSPISLIAAVSVSPAPLTGDGHVCHIPPHYHRRPLTPCSCDCAC